MGQKIAASRIFFIIKMASSKILYPSSDKSSQNTAGDAKGI